MNKLTTIDLFAGCGGLMEGFERSGLFNTLACVEWELAPCENLVTRLRTKWGHLNAQKEVIRFDIQRTQELFSGFEDPIYGKSQGLDSVIGSRKVDVIIGGPPCQAYSIAGRIRDANGMRNDYRNYLFEAYLEVVKHYKPDFVLFEHVVGLLSAAPDGTPIVEKICQRFKDAGYCILSNLRDAVFDLQDYGVPQRRRRVIILGVRAESFGLPLATRMLDAFYHSIVPSFRTSIETVWDAISDLPAYTPLVENDKVNYQLQGKTQVANHVPRHHSVRDVNLFRLLTEDIEQKRFEYISTDSLKKLYTQITGRVSNIHKYYVLRWDQPSNTIPAHLYKDGFRHIHPDSHQCRTITVREAARLQSFPDDYVFSGSMSDQYKMIGNAVPPVFAKVLAYSLARVYYLFCPEKMPEDCRIFNISQHYKEADTPIPRLEQLAFFEPSPKDKN